MIFLSILDVGDVGISLWDLGLYLFKNMISTVFGFLSLPINSLFADSGGGPWSVVVNLMKGAILGFAFYMVVLYFYLGVVKTASGFFELKRPEFIFKALARLIVTLYLVVNSPIIIAGIYDIFAGFIGELSDSLTIPFVNTPAGIREVVSTCGFWKGIVCILIGFFGLVVMSVCTFKILIAIYGRVFKIFMYALIAPVGLAGFAGEGEPSHIAKNYVKAFVSICLEGVLIMACIIVFTLVGDHFEKEFNDELDETKVYTAHVSTEDASVVMFEQIWHGESSGHFMSNFTIEEFKYTFDQIIDGGYNDGGRYLKFSDPIAAREFSNMLNSINAYFVEHGVIAGFGIYIAKMVLFVVLLSTTIGMCDNLASRILGG